MPRNVEKSGPGPFTRPAHIAIYFAGRYPPKKHFDFIFSDMFEINFSFLRFRAVSLFCILHFPRFLRIFRSPNFLQIFRSSNFLSRCVSVRPEVGARVRLPVFTVAILAQGTNRGDALCAVLLLNHVLSNPSYACFALAFLLLANVR